jgi:hypothetical protein
MMETVGRVGKVYDIQLAVEMLHYATHVRVVRCGIAVDRRQGFHARHDSDPAKGRKWVGLHETGM